MTVFSGRMRKAMHNKNMTQTDLCRITGVPKSAVSQYLSGNFKPKLERIILIADALEVSASWLLGID